MNTNYKRTFDAVRMLQARKDQIRSDLSSYLSAKYEKDNLINTRRHSFKNFRLVAITATAILTLALVGFTYGSQIIQLMGGVRIEEGKYINSIYVDGTSDPVKVEDGQIYFILDGSSRNITNQCSEVAYYEYERISDKGYRHVVLVGGTPDNVGVAGFVWDKNGNLRGNYATYNGDDEPMWLILGRAKFLKD